MARIIVDHRTEYRFTAPQARLVQLLRVKPQDTVDQTVVNWHVGVDCDVRLRESRDGYGNTVTMLYAEGPLDGIALHVQGEVLTASDDGVVRGAHEPLPSDLYLRQTDRTRGSLELLAFVADHALLDGSPGERLHRLNLALHQRFDPVPVHHDDGRSAREVFAGTTASPRDLAHLFLSCAREVRIPARYVSGYRADGDHAPAPHAWAEACVPGLGWVSFDPARGISADTGYVRVAVALDAAGAAPVAGSRLGEGAEQLDVDVQVETVGADG